MRRLALVAALTGLAAAAPALAAGGDGLGSEAAPPEDQGSDVRQTAPAKPQQTARREQQAPAGTVDEGGTPRQGRPGRVLSGLRIRRSRRRLIVTFRLSRSARVALRASRGGRVVARRPLRTLSRGRRRLVLRYRGKRPPTGLRVVVRPLEGR